MTAHFVVCADDYGISEATSDTIRDLLEDGAVNATSCLVEHADWSRFAGPLRRLTEHDGRIAVGLHLNLTEPFANVSDGDVIQPVARHLASMPFARAEATRRMARAFARQWDLFEAAMGRPPDFIDGHEHVHLLPAATRAVIDLAAARGFKGWLRQCRSSNKRRGAKWRLLDYLSEDFIRSAIFAGVAINPGFGGLRQFGPRERPEDIWRDDIAAMRFGGVLMVHPGASTGMQPLDSIRRFRTQEAELLRKGALRGILHLDGGTALNWPGAGSRPAPLVLD